VENRLRPGDIAADRPAKRLAQRAGDNIDLNAMMRRRAFALRPHKTGGVAIIHHHQCLVFLGQRHNLGQVGEVAIHREYAVGGDHDETRAVVAGLFQLGLQIVHVAVPVNHPSDLLPAQPAGVDYAGMVQFVADYNVVLAQ